MLEGSWVLFYILDGHRYALQYWCFLRAFLQTLRILQLFVSGNLSRKLFLPSSIAVSQWIQLGSSLQPRESLQTELAVGVSETGGSPQLILPFEVQSWVPVQGCS